jgi:hypothetical protein
MTPASLPRLFRFAAQPRCLIALLVATLLFGAAMLPAMHTMSDHGHSLSSFENAGSVNRSQEILDDWGGAGKSAAWWQLAIDIPFLTAYGLLLAGCCTAVVQRAQSVGKLPLAAVGAVVVWFGPFAAAADLLQDISLGLVLAGHVSQPWPRISAVAVTVIWLLVAPAALFAFAGFLGTRGAPRVAEQSGA